MEGYVRDITQFATVTPDVDQTVEVLQSALGLGPFKVWDFSHPMIFDTTIGGAKKPWSMKLAFGWVGNIQLEVISPSKGETLYKTFLDKHKRAGIQHLLASCRDTSYVQAKKQLAVMGYPIDNEARVNTSIRLGPMTLPPLPMVLARSMSTIFGYANTLDTLMFALEISQYPPGLSPRLGIRLSVPTYWSSGERQHFEQLPETSSITAITGSVVLVRNMRRVRPNFIALFGEPLTTTEKKLTFALQSGSLIVMQPDAGSAYEAVLNDRGEGVCILKALSRYASKQKTDAMFTQNNFHSVEISGTERLYTRTDMPFDVLCHNLSS